MSAEPAESQLEWEARRSRPAAVAALAAGVLPLLASVILTPLITVPDEEGLGPAARVLLSTAESTGPIVGFTVANAIAFALVGPALAYLLRATVLRHERVPAITMPLLLAAAVGLGVALVVQQVFVIDVAQDFAAAADQSEQAANATRTGGVVGAFSYVILALGVALGAAVILVAINAMRAGLVSRFMGIIGVVAGVLFALPQLRSVGLPLQSFWLIAVGFLYLGRWPGGRGPAWERVEAVPWPTAADRAEQERGERVEAAQRTASEREEDGDSAGASTPARPRPASRKKRRGGADAPSDD